MFFSKKKAVEAPPVLEPIVQLDYQIDTNALTDKLREAYVKASSKILTIRREQVQQLIDGWIKEMVKDFEEAVREGKDTIYFFNHNRELKKSDWLYAAECFVQKMKQHLGLPVEISPTDTVYIRIKTKDLEKILETPEMEKKFHQQGIYR